MQPIYQPQYQQPAAQAPEFRRDEVIVKPTWRLAWGLFWKQMLLGLALYLVIALPLMLIFGITQMFGK